MKVGDKIDPVVLGHIAIDLKGLLQASGYVMPQGSVAKLPRIPAEVQKQIDDIHMLQEQYEYTGEVKEFYCPAPLCGTKNSAEYRREVSTGTEFLVCGECNTVAEVR